MTITLPQLVQTLQDATPNQISHDGHKAAVAAIFRVEASELELLFIKRAPHPQDPWSGHMAFPGGKIDPTDRSPLAAAIRETQEEIGLDLHETSCLGALSELNALAVKRALVVSPFVFHLKKMAPFHLNPDEVDEAIWVPLAFFLDPKARTSMTRTYYGQSWRFPAYHYQGRRIWGLTLRMLDELLIWLGHGFDDPNPTKLD